MERRGSFHRYQRNQGSISGSSKLNNCQNRYAAMDSGGGDGGGSSSNNGCLPYANLLRIMKKVLPNHAKVSDSAKETIQECIAEYINFITREANDKCKQEHRKTVTSEDILWAMHKLGFDDYIEPLNTYLNRYRELEGDLRGSLKGEPLPRKAAHVGPWASPPAVGPNVGPALQIGQHQAGPSGVEMAAYLGDGSGANPTQQPMAGFNPFAA